MSSASFAAFRYPDFRRLLGARLCTLLAQSSMFTVIGFHIYYVSHSKTALGGLGLAEAIPSLSMLLFGGHVADRGDRRALLIGSSAVLVLASLILVAASGKTLPPFYIAVMIVGFAQGFWNPAFGAMEAQVLPTPVALAAQGLIGSLMQAGQMLGPALGGFLYVRAGFHNAFLVIGALLLGCNAFCWSLGKVEIPPKLAEKESIWKSIRDGWLYVRTNQVLIGSMALDLFAVLFGGAVALIPVFAADILHVKPDQASLLTSATSAGAFLGMALCVRFNPNLRAGRNLLLTITGFGISILIFALSHNFYLSLAAIFLSGVFDGVSMIIRRVVFRSIVPNELRGRVGAVNMMFIGASNEIGAAESGFAAQLLGTVPSVVAGAVVCLGVVVVSALKLPELRRFGVDPATVQPNTSSGVVDS